MRLLQCVRRFVPSSWQGGTIFKGDALYRARSSRSGGEKSTEVWEMPTKILAVDDSRSMRALLKMTLASSGFDVEEAEDGQAALDWLENNEVDLIITDINMPRLDGYGLIETLRSEHRRHVDRPILVLTTECTEEKRARGRDAGATGWIVKPFDPERLVAAVRHAVH